MRDKVKRFLSILMTALMLVNLLPVGALAEGVTISNSVQSRGYQKPSANVYVYVKVTGDKAGLTINQSGWYTIGKSENVPGMGTPYWSMHGSHSFSDVGVSYKTVLKTNFTRWTDNQKIDLDQITWTEFYVDNGADDYVKAGTYTWHMNGTIDIKQLPSVYTIKYVDYDTKKLIASYEKTGLMGQAPEEITAPDSLKENLYSFYFVKGHPKKQTVDFKKDKGELTFYYRQQTVNVKYSHKNGGTVTRTDDAVQVLSGKVVDGDTVKSPDSVVSTANPKDGYVFVGWYKQNAQGVENEFVSANRDLKAGDVTNHLNKKNGRYTSTVYQALFVEKSALEYTVYHRDAITHENIADPETKTATLEQYVAGMISANSQQKSIDGYTYKESPDFIKIPIENGENKLYLYYTRNSYDYTVHYYWNGTTEPVAGDTTGTLNAGETKEVWPEEIEGYTPVLSEKKTITEGNNEITFYYYKNVTLTSASDSKVYDGTPLTNHTVTADGFVGNDNVTCNVWGSQTDAGEGKNEFAYMANNEIDSKYKITKLYGSLRVTKRPVTLTSASDEKVYDGQPLTNETVEVSGDGFAKDEGATYDVTGSQTVVGESDNTFTYTLNKGTKADNYTIEKAEGKLKVTAVTDEVVVTIKENAGTTKYDGTEKTVTGYTVTNISNKLYAEKDFTFNGKAEVKGTDAGTYDMALKASDFTNRNANFSKVTFVIEDGQLVIEKRKVTLTSGSGEKVYDGTALTNGTVTVSGDGFVKGEGATYDVTGTQTNVGKSKNTFSYKLKDNTKAENYTITTSEGTLEVTAATDEVVVTIKENAGTAKYDGTEKTVTGYTVTNISNKLYAEKDFTFNGKAEVKGTDAGTYDMALKASDFTNRNANFSKVTFVIEDGQLVIEKRKVTLTSGSGEKVYDGNALTNGEVTVSGDGFVKGEGATYEVTGTQTNVGKSNNTFTYTLNEGTKADNYTITTAEGELEVTPVTAKVTVTITEKSGTVTYDGGDHIVSGYKSMTADNTLYDVATSVQETPTEAWTAKGTDVGEYPVGIAAGDFKNTNANFSNVEFVVVDGTLKITPVTDKVVVTITENSDTVAYDGKEHTVTGYKSMTADNPLYDVSASVEETPTEAWTAKGTDVGEYPVGIAAGDFKNTNANFSNVEFVVVDGTLKITPVTDEVIVTIMGKTKTVTYDGKEHSVFGYDATPSNKLYNPKEDMQFEGFDEDMTAKGTDAGTHTMGLTADQFHNKDNGNFTNVTFVVEKDGYVKINPRPVTLTSGSAERVYNGKPLMNETVTVGGDGFAKDEGVTYDFTGSQTDVGESENTFTFEANEGTSAKNYSFEFKFGTLKVTPFTDKVTVTITEKSGTVTYDGKEHIVSGYASMTADNELYDVDASVQETPTAAWTVKGKDAGEYPVGIKADDFKNTNGNFTNVKFVVVDGKLTITPAPVTLQAPIQSKTYDGTPLEATQFGHSYLEGVNFADDFASVILTGSQTLVGSSSSLITGVIPNEGKKLTNYNFTFVPGTLTVTDGTGDDPVKPENVVTKTHIPKDMGYNLGEPVTFTISVKNIYNTPKTITLTEKANVKFSNGESVIVFNDVPAGETVTAEATYTITSEDILEGVFRNTVTATFGDDKSWKATDDVTTAELDTTLNVTKTSDVPDGQKAALGQKITYTIKVQNAGNVPYTNVKVEDPLTGLTETIETLPVGETRTFTTEYVVTEADVLEGHVLNTVTAKGDKIKDPKSDEPKEPNGGDEVEIKTFAPITLKPKDVTATYNGAAITGKDVEITSGKLLEGHKLSAAVVGSGVNAGSYELTLDPEKIKIVDANNKDVSEMYARTILPGKLIINKRSVLITSQSATKTYDGSALTRPAVTITGDGFVPGELAKAEATGSITKVGSTPNAIQYTTTGAFNAANYSIALSVGTLTVTEKPKPEPRRTFNLTINYVYQNGKRAAASYNRGGLKNGETFDITSPVIAGYTASETVVSGTIYNRDIKVTVIYTADGVNLDDYGVPLGLGNITMNVGDCFE